LHGAIAFQINILFRIIDLSMGRQTKVDLA